MTKKPKGRKYRNLVARGGVIYLERVVDGKRMRRSLKTDDWALAAQIRDAYDVRTGTRSQTIAESPRVRDFAERYLREDTRDLAWTTLRDRESHLRADGPVLRFFEGHRLDDITPGELRRWWGQEVEGAVSARTQKPLSTKTGRSYLDTLSAVLRYARDLEILEGNPVAEFREVLSRKNRTKQGRAGAKPKAQPIEDPEGLARLVEEAQKEHQSAHVLVLLGLDAGLRLGEALGLRWGHIVWGEDENDLSRVLRIQESRPRGGSPTTTKSGRDRDVALSKRLRAELLKLNRERFSPSPEVHVLDRVEPTNFRHREWRRICERAGVGHRQLKDLRDSYASWLLTCGVQLGYVSHQLGHADVAVTAKHYARWVGGAEFRRSLIPSQGEVAADLLARLTRSDPAFIRLGHGGFLQIDDP